MPKSATNIVIIDDDEELKEDELVFELEQLYENVIILPSPDTGIEYLQSHLHEKNIVVLDYRFTDDKSGHDVLVKIRESLSQTIPVILWTANSDKITEIDDFINLHTFAIVPKAPYQYLLDKIKQAELALSTSIEGALEEWLLIQKSRRNDDDPFLLTVSGNQFTLNDLLKEVRLQTKFGKKFVNDINMLTIDLLLRGKEEI